MTNEKPTPGFARVPVAGSGVTAKSRFLRYVDSFACTLRLAFAVCGMCGSLAKSVPEHERSELFFLCSLVFFRGPNFDWHRGRRRQRGAQYLGARTWGHQLPQRAARAGFPEAAEEVAGVHAEALGRIAAFLDDDGGLLERADQPSAAAKVRRAEAPGPGGIATPRVEAEAHDQ